MDNQQIAAHFAEAASVLEQFRAGTRNLEAVLQAGNLMVAALRSGGKLISCGNGGSLCDAMHFAEELTGKFRNDRAPIAAICINDPGHLTCVGNDYGYEQVFARFVQAHGKAGDVLLAISTSGNSPNVLRAAEAARERGMKVVGLTGKDGGKLAALCHAEVRVAHTGYADRVQEVHIKVVHAWIDHIERALA
ncbi:MAG: D-sedoheptulose 7-phosphate isomerase [Bacteroidetes bacterium]|nr:D-sedoheptulose 7-phosphate isomerase [Bacteroidota bacterium]MBS1945590.1 D-sedoheptulose 7-phosphate isomerase [Bacteroidota bacterium]